MKTSDIRLNEDEHSMRDADCGAKRFPRKISLVGNTVYAEVKTQKMERKIFGLYILANNGILPVSSVHVSAAGERKNLRLSQSPQSTQRRPQLKRLARGSFFACQEIHSFPVDSASSSAAGERKSLCLSQRSQSAQRRPRNK